MLRTLAPITASIIIHSLMSRDSWMIEAIDMLLPALPPWRCLWHDVKAQGCECKVFQDDLCDGVLCGRPVLKFFLHDWYWSRAKFSHTPSYHWGKWQHINHLLWLVGIISYLAPCMVTNGCYACPFSVKTMDRSCYRTMLHHIFLVHCWSNIWLCVMILANWS